MIHIFYLLSFAVRCMRDKLRRTLIDGKTVNDVWSNTCVHVYNGYGHNTIAPVQSQRSQKNGQIQSKAP